MPRNMLQARWIRPCYECRGNRETTGTFTYSTATGNQLASDGKWNYFYDRNNNLVQKTNISTGEVYAYGYDNREIIGGYDDGSNEVGDRNVFKEDGAQNASKETVLQVVTTQAV